MKVGLALSGGAARGIAHIGVIRYLEDKGIKPCCVAGTSAGSIVGALYCSGKSIDELENIARTVSWKDLVKFSLPKMGLIKSTRLLKIIKEYIGDVSFDELEIPLVINAVDLLSGEEVIIDQGSVAEAVEASCAIPGIFTPVKREQRLLVDGGLLDNIPVAHMRNKDLDFIIAVNVGAEKPLQKEPGSIFEVLFQSYDIIRRHRDMPAEKYADILIEPKLGDIAFYDTGKADLLIKRGYKAAAENLESVNLKKKPGRLSRWLGRRKKQRELRAG